MFVINNLDPRTILGIFPLLAEQFIDYLTSLLLLQAIACALYMYLLIVFQQTLTHVPTRLKQVWMGVNIALFVLEFLALLVGCSSNNLFWFGINDSILLPLHFLLMFIVWNVNLGKIVSCLNQSQGMIKVNTDNLRGAIRKIMYLRILSVVISPLAIAYELGAFGGYDRLVRWGEPITPFDNEHFSALQIVSPFLKGSTLALLLYALRRPTPKRASATAMSFRLSHLSSSRTSLVTDGSSGRPKPVLPETILEKSVEEETSSVVTEIV